jgi:glyoxylase I family protein
MRFHHVALNCADQAVTEAFYTRYFGFQRARVFDVGDGKQVVFIRCGDTYLELFPAAAGRDGAAPVKDGPTGQGERHLAFMVDDVDVQLRSMGEAARVTLGPLSFDSLIPGWRTAWLSDPDGNVVEISHGFTDCAPERQG